MSFSNEETKLLQKRIERIEKRLRAKKHFVRDNVGNLIECGKVRQVLEHSTFTSEEIEFMMDAIKEAVIETK